MPCRISQRNPAIGAAVLPQSVADQRSIADKLYRYAVDLKDKNEWKGTLSKEDVIKALELSMPGSGVSVARSHCP